jgi:23S rRNA pseudouridine1911/1915/1917 synthase
VARGVGGVPREGWLVPASLAGERVDRAVALLTGWSRSDVATLIEEGAVRVDGQPVAKSRRLAEGEEVEVEGEPEPEALPVAEPVEFPVVHADDDVVVVAKPAGLVVHPGAGHETGTLAAGLLHRFPEIAGVGDPMRPGIVHRLDRDTSGLMVVARSARAYDALTAALAAREIERRYLALAWGRFDARRGTIDAPIGRSATRRTRMAVLGAIGHPVVGDGTYGGDRNPLQPGRPFLHAHVLALIHPATGERLEFSDPLPPELMAVLSRLEL